MLSRNDPCWCGSGSKYKFCHEKMDTKLNDYLFKGYDVPDHTIIKNQTTIDGMKASAVITTGILDYITDKLKPGMKTIEIDQMVYDYTIERGGIPATLGYKGYEKSCCTSINEVICHGIPSEDDVIKDGDIINVDVTTILNGYFSDSSRMYMIGDVSQRAKDIVEITYECMMVGINVVKPYISINLVGETIEAFANNKGYSVVRDLGGHGIGLEFHEDPHVNHFKSDNKGMILVPGMTFTVEPMINEKSYKAKFLDDGWTVMTTDGGLSAQWEHTILVTETGFEIIT